MNHPVKYSLSIAARITIIYIVVGSLWIYYSDQFLLGVTKDSSILSMLQSYKGWLFILTSAAMLYLLVRGMTATVERAHWRTSQANQATLDGLLRAIELRDRDTEGHSQRVVHIALRLAQELDLPESKMQPLSQGALLHDIGKIGVPDSILRKPSKLTKAEWESMRQHPQRGYDLLRSVEHLKEAAVIPLYHHERWDGSGYPNGLRGEAIPLEARVFAVADVWDALYLAAALPQGLERKEGFRLHRGKLGQLVRPCCGGNLRPLKEKRADLASIQPEYNSPRTRSNVCYSPRG